MGPQGSGFANRVGRIAASVDAPIFSGSNRVTCLGEQLACTRPVRRKAMILAAVAGLGLCQMPCCLFQDDIDAGRLVEVLSDYEPEPVEVHAVWPKVAHLRPKVRFVVDELVRLCEHWV